MRNVSHPGVLNTGQIANVSQYLGYNLHSETGALVTIRHGAANGPILDTVALAAGESARAWYGESGIHVGGTLAFVVESGSLSELSTLRVEQVP